MLANRSGISIANSETGQQLGLGAGPLDVALKGAQLLMKAPPDLAHRPNPPVLSAQVLESLAW
jgi:hypothetical protein